VLALIGKIKLVADEAFSDAFKATPQHYCARVTVVSADGRRVSAQSGGDEDDLAAPKSDAWIGAKFERMTEAFGAERSRGLLVRLWRLSEERDVASLPPAFVLE
jgi:hypothetical protein